MEDYEAVAWNSTVLNTALYTQIGDHITRLRYEGWQLIGWVNFYLGALSGFYQLWPKV